MIEENLNILFPSYKEINRDFVNKLILGLIIRLCNVKNKLLIETSRSSIYNYYLNIY